MIDKKIIKKISNNGYIFWSLMTCLWVFSFFASIIITDFIIKKII
jgi:hypothetical protein